MISLSAGQDVTQINWSLNDLSEGHVATQVPWSRFGLSVGQSYPIQSSSKPVPTLKSELVLNHNTNWDVSEI